MILFIAFQTVEWINNRKYTETLNWNSVVSSLSLSIHSSPSLSLYTLLDTWPLLCLPSSAGKTGLKQKLTQNEEWHSKSIPELWGMALHRSVPKTFCWITVERTGAHCISRWRWSSRPIERDQEQGLDRVSWSKGSHHYCYCLYLKTHGIPMLDKYRSGTFSVSVEQWWFENNITCCFLDWCVKG